MKTRRLPSQNASFIKSIRNAIPKHCSNCGYKYEDSDLSVVRQENYNTVLHLTCRNCRESYLINVVSPSGVLQGSSRTQLKIDITSPKEAKKFIGKSAVSSDDVLTAHSLLKEVKSAKELNDIFKSTS